MEFLLTVSDFITKHLNIIMIVCGLIAIGCMFLLLALNRKRNRQLELRRMKKIQEDKLLDEELEGQIANAINLSAEDITENGEVENMSEDSLEEESPELVEDESVAQISEDDDVEDKEASQKEEIEQEEPLVSSEEGVEQEDESNFEEAEVNNAEEPFVETDVNEAEIEQKEEDIVDSPAEEDEIKQEENEEQPNVLDNYESVIKESDAMLAAMQDIIDDNIEEVQKLESEPLEVPTTSIKESSVNIVSKYKVLFDKVKKEWVVKKEGATRAIKRCKTKEEAIEFAKKCTIDAEIGNTFHQKDGKFQKRAKK